MLPDWDSLWMRVTFLPGIFMNVAIQTWTCSQTFVGRCYWGAVNSTSNIYRLIASFSLQMFISYLFALYACSLFTLFLAVCLLYFSYRDSGALGSRLTGAGWGGCAVSLVPEANIESFLTKVSAGFYSEDRLKDRTLEQVFFKTSPASGACIYKC